MQCDAIKDLMCVSRIVGGAKRKQVSVVTLRVTIQFEPFAIELHVHDTTNSSISL